MTNSKNSRKMSSKNSMRITRPANMKKQQQKRLVDHADIDEEILFCEILPRLPIKQIIRFSLVCRRWFKVIKNDVLFTVNQAYHSIHSSSNQSAFMYPNHDDSLSVISFEEQSRYRLPPPFPSMSRLRSKLLYVGSCNGLVFGFNSFKRTFVCNPITHRIVFVKNFHKDRFLPLYGIALAFDPPLPPYAGPELMRFKLICPSDNLDKMTFNVYCSAKREWHDSNAYVELHSKISSWESDSPHYVLVKGNVYWFNDIFMVWFNVEEEVAGTIPLPTNSSGITASVGVCDGDLSYCHITMDSELNVWLRRGQWVKLHEVRLDTIIRDNWNVIAPDTMKLRNCGTAFLRNHLVSTMSYEGGDMLMFWMGMKQGKRVFGFNSKTSELKELSAPDLTQSYTSAWPYKAIILRTQIGDQKRIEIS